MGRLESDSLCCGKCIFRGEIRVSDDGEELLRSINPIVRG